MPKAIFALLRVLVAIGALSALAASVLVLLFESALGLLKNSFHIGLVLTRFFTSGLRDPGPDPPNEQLLAYPVIALAILFAAMFVSVFTPGQRIFLHIIAAGAFTAAAWRAWIMFQTHDHHLIFLPLLVLWTFYYLACLQRR